MKKKVKELGMRLWLLFSILFLYSCHRPNQEAPESSHSIDTVVIQQMKFNPAWLTVEKGDTIVWINKDLVDHTVKEEKENGFYSDTIHLDNTWKMVATESADYDCSIHPTMKGKIAVRR